MSEVTPEKEIEVVAGTIGSTIRKKEDTWQIEVDVGQQNPKRLWTKDAELVKAMEAKFGQHGAFVCGASYWTNREGVEVRSLWINSVAEEGATPGVSGAPPQAASSVATPDAAPRGGEGMSKEEWARKDSAIHKMACIKTAADALKHTIPSDPSTEDLNTFLTRVTHLTLAWHRSVLAERDDPAGEDVPF